MIGGREGKGDVNRLSQGTARDSAVINVLPVMHGDREDEAESHQPDD